MIYLIWDRIICANAGDSRAILVSESKHHKKKNQENFEVEPLSIDHKPEIEAVKKRIHSSGGRVEQFTGN